MDVSITSDGPGGLRDRRFDGPALVGTPIQTRSLVGWLSGFLVGLASALVCAFARNSLIDDAYITLAYARNLAFHHHWGLTQHSISNTATSPLNVVVLGLFTFLIRNPVLATCTVFVLCNVIGYDALRRAAIRAGLPTWFALLAAAFAVVNPLMISSIGLDVALGGMLAALLLAEAGDRPIVAGVVAGLLLLTRLDLGIIALALLLGRRETRRQWRKSLFTMLAVSAPWFLFSWLKLGSAVPDTLIIKLQQKSWTGGYTFTNGWQQYFAVYPGATVLSFLPALCGLLALGIWAALRVARPSVTVRRLDAVAPLAAGGVLHFLAYSWLGVPPYHWYYAASISALTVFFAAAVGALVAGSGSAVQRARTYPLRMTVAAAAVLLVGADIGFLGREMRPPAYAPITTNWASSAEYARIGLDVRRLIGNSTVASPGEIGVIVYFCGCAVVDAFSDRGYLPELVTKVKAEHSAVERALINVNYEFFDWNVRPRRREFALRYVHVPAPDAIAAWPVTSPWSGSAYFELVRARG